LSLRPASVLADESTEKCIKKCIKECTKIAPGSAGYCDTACKDDCDRSGEELTDQKCTEEVCE
jgi:hypothetical protein